MTSFSSHKVVRAGRSLVRLACLCLFAGAGVHGGRAQDAAQPPTASWQSTVVGEAAPAGSTAVTGDAFTVSASGADVQAAADAFRFVDRPAEGNVTITARVASLNSKNAWAKAGVMVRTGLGADAQNAFLAVTPAHGVTFQRREVTGGDTATTPVSDTAMTPVWLRLRRIGAQIAGFTIRAVRPLPLID